MILSVGATLQGEPRSQGVDTLNLHLATPERDGHTHYWYWASRDFAISAEANAFIRQMVAMVPQGTEAGLVDLDAEIAQLLSA